MTTTIFHYEAMPLDLEFMKSVANDRYRSRDDMIRFVAMLTDVPGVEECGTVHWGDGGANTDKLYVRASKSKVGKLDQTCSPNFALTAFDLSSEYVPSAGILEACEHARKQKEARKVDEIDPAATMTETRLGFDNIQFNSEVYPIEGSKGWFEVTVTATGPRGNRMIGPMRIEVGHKKDVIGRALAEYGMGFESRNDEELVFWWYEPNGKLADLMRSIGWKRGERPAKAARWM